MTQKIFFGNNLQSKINNLIKKINPSSILLVSGQKSYSISGADQIINEATKKYKTYRFSSFSNNPKIEDTLKGIKLIKEIKPNLIIAVEGGSVIDMGKQINILSNNSNIKDLIISKKKLRKSSIPMIAIPTTAGTGSESTSFAVVYIDNKKYSVENTSMLPNYAFIIPKLGENVPNKIKATCAFDAFSQSIESYWSINSTKQSKNISARAIKIIKNNIIKTLKGSKASNSELFKAANLSGQAINISKTTAAHAISYILSSKFNLPHGHSVALTLGKFFEFNMPNKRNQVSDTRGKKYLARTMRNLYKLLGFTNYKECENYWFKTLKQCNLQIDYKQIGIHNKQNLDYIIKHIDTNRAKNNPIMITSENIRELLES